MKMSHLSRLAIGAILGAAASLQAATFVQFQASTNQWSGGSQIVQSDYYNSKNRIWYFDMATPLYTSTPPIYGGINVVNTATSEAGSSIGYNDNTPATWPNIP